MRVEPPNMLHGIEHGGTAEIPVRFTKMLRDCVGIAISQVNNIYVDSRSYFAIRHRCD
jgi:hypothetical protein